MEKVIIQGKECNVFERVSRKQVKDILATISREDKSYCLVTHEHLGNAKQMSYKYSICVYDGQRKRIETVIDNVSLKEAYRCAMDLNNALLKVMVAWEERT